MKKFTFITTYFLGLLLSTFLGIFLVLSLSVHITQAQSTITESDFDPKLIYNEWNGQDPWSPCRQWVDVSGFDDALKAEAVTCVEMRDAALKERRDFYLDPNMGRKKATDCYSVCTDACFAGAKAIGITVNCNNGYTPYPKSDVERTMVECKAVCSKAVAEEENALRSPLQVLRVCCEALKDRIPEPVEDHSCFDGVQNGNEDGVDCGGSCESSCESDLYVTISPKEVEMVADGKTSMDFVVTVTQDGKPLAGQEVSYRLQDERGRIDDDKEGVVKSSSAKTDAKGQIKLTYTTAEQPRDFATSTLVIQAIHPNGNPQARITLTPGFSIWCGNWECQTGETNANCPQDCSRNMTKQEAYDFLVKKYNELPLNPYARQGVWCASCPTNNRVLKALAIETFSSDQANLDYAKRLKEQYEPWVCGSQQTRVINMLDGLRLSKDATERSVIEKYFDYGPIEVLAIPGLNPLAGHLAVAVYDKGALWSDAAKIFDLWLMNSHGIYGISEWEDMVHGQAKGFQCDPPFYPLCGGTYERVQRPELKLSADEQQYYNNLNQETKNKIDASINERVYKDVKEAQKKYLIERMMAFDAKEKVRVVVQCPFNVMVVNKATGARVGYDAQGNFMAEDPEIYPEIRAFADNEVISYFVMPKAGQYEVKAVGIDSGKANVMTSFPTNDGQFEIYKYDDIEVKSNSNLLLNLNINNKTSALSIDDEIIEPELFDKGVAEDGVDFMLDLAKGMYAEENKPENGNQIFPVDFPPLNYKPVFDGWSLFLLFVSLLCFISGIMVFMKLQKNGKKVLAIVMLLGLPLLGLLLILIVLARYMWIQVEVGSDYRKEGSGSVVTQLVATLDQTKEDMAGNNVKNNFRLYQNTEYGFSLNMTPSWTGLLAESLTVDNDYPEAVISFYLPTKEDSEYSDRPGYMKMFVVYVYDPASWNAYRKECESIDLCWEEEAGRNNDYVFGWSHFNGIQPTDIPEQAVTDIQAIIQSFKSIDINKTPVSVDWTNGAKMHTYNNCIYHYSVGYPERWTTITSNQKVQYAKFHGNDVAISVSAELAGETSLEDFAKKQTVNFTGTVVSTRDQERDGKRLIANQYENPEAVYVYWQDDEYNLELAVTGKQVNEFIENTNFFSLFNTNSENNCQ